MRYLLVPSAAPAAVRLPPVVFVHGLLGYSFSWRHNLEVFAQRRDVYAIDLLGIGHSDRPERGAADFGLAATASRLAGFLRSLGHSQIDLVGTSHGGAVAMLAVSMDRSSPEPLVRRLVLVAPANPFMPNARVRLAVFGSRFGRLVMRGVRRLGLSSGRLRRIAMCRMYGDISRITAETRVGYEVNFSDPRSYDYALEVVKNWRRDMQQVEAALPAIADVPVLLLWGGADKAVSPKSGLRLRQSFHNAQYVVLPDVGHLPYEELPDEFNRLVLQFLES